MENLIDELKLKEKNFLNEKSTGENTFAQDSGINESVLNDANLANIQCEECQSTFQCEEEYDEHMCFFCEYCSQWFYSQYEFDLHEHALHPEDYFQVNILTPNSKRHATERLNQQLQLRR